MGRRAVGVSVRVHVARCGDMIVLLTEAVLAAWEFWGTGEE